MACDLQLGAVEAEVEQREKEHRYTASPEQPTNERDELLA